MTTPGEEALREAARRETARVYGSTSRDEICGRRVDKRARPVSNPTPPVGNAGPKRNSRAAPSAAAEVVDMTNRIVRTGAA